MATPAEIEAAPQTPPPIEPFWSKYSPNQEFPLSTVISVALHVGVLAILVVFVSMLKNDSPPDMLIEGFGGDINAGGGGDPSASEVNNNAAGQRVERAGPDEVRPEDAKSNVSLGSVPDPKNTLPDLPINPESDRIFESGADARARLDKVGKTTTDAARSAGQGGPGTGGGQGTGKGPGTGSGEGPGNQGSVRQRRNTRWTIQFDTTSGTDYLHQLHVLGAVLVCDFPDGSMMMFRQLNKKPVPAEEFDPDIRQRMRWVDERPGAVRDLADAMGLTRGPVAIRAYFPFKLEKELLSLELGYRGRNEDEIHSTTFKAIVTGGSYRVVVVEQRYK